MRNCQPKSPSTVATLDGLLAALFTSPGSATPSVQGLLSKQRLDSSAVQQGLLKVTKRIHHWKEYVGRLQRGASNWLADVLQDYDPSNPTVPVLAEGQPKKDLHALMTMDPSLGYSYRRPLSDGHMTKKTNVAVRGTPYAALLALLGASRFLRAQPLGGHLVNFYVPLPGHLVIDASTTLPILTLVACAPDQAIIWRWLALSSTEQQPAATWHGLAYQTLQRQPQHQAIALGSGVLESRWLTTLTEQVGQGIISFWRGWLDQQGRRTLDEQGHLVDCLKQRRMEAWLLHLSDVVFHVVRGKDTTVRRYHLEEVRRITMSMEENSSHPLRTVLERKAGTLRFGHALRLLGYYNPSILRDLIELLEGVQTQEQLLPVLYRVMQECILASAKSRYIVIPTDDDFPYLLDDVHRYGVRILVGLLMVLSVLSYPPPEGVDKYEVHTLITVLLLLAAQNISAQEESQAGTSSHAPETFSGESQQMFPFLEGEQSDDH